MKLHSFLLTKNYRMAQQVSSRMVLVAMGACLLNSSLNIDMALICLSMCWHLVMQ